MRLVINILSIKKEISLIFSLLSFLGLHYGNAQHCTSGFHFAVDGYTVIFDDQSTADGGITSYSWDFGDGESSDHPNPTHTYLHSGTFNVCLTIVTHNPGCTATYCHHVVINEPPPGICHALYSVHQADPDILAFDLTDQSTSDGNIVSWSWDFGDGNSSIEQSPTHTYSLPGAYQVCLNIADDEGCTSHFCHELIVHHPVEGVCHASFTAHQNDPDQQIISFTDQSTSDGHIVSWLWDLGDGHSTTTQNPSHTYQEPGTYLVCLFITDDAGCTSHFCHEVVVHHSPAGVCHALFAAHETHKNTLQIDFTDLSTSDDNIGSWLWEFGDGTTSTEQNPTHTYNHSGTYLVCLFITDEDGGCTSHFCHHLTLHHIPAAMTNSIRKASIDDSYLVQNKHNAQVGQKPSALNPLPSLVNSNMNGDESDNPVYISIYPNPISGLAHFQYDLAYKADVKLEVFSLLGEIVLQTNNNTQEKGIHNLVLNGQNLQTGSYMVRMVVDGQVFAARMIVVN